MCMMYTCERAQKIVGVFDAAIARKAIWNDREETQKSKSKTRFLRSTHAVHSFNTYTAPFSRKFVERSCIDFCRTSWAVIETRVHRASSFYFISSPPPLLFYDPIVCGDCFIQFSNMKQREMWRNWTKFHGKVSSGVNSGRDMCVSLEVDTLIVKCEYGRRRRRRRHHRSRRVVSFDETWHELDDFAIIFFVLRK